jgi:PAS domain S-box-containing protein
MMDLNVAHHEAEKRFSQLERQLRVNEERWGAVIANPFMGITVLDKNQYFIMANATFQAMVGYTEDELKKLTPLDITPEGDREINRVLFRELQQGKRQHFEMVKRLRRKDGKMIWIQLYVFGIPDRGSQGQHTFGMNFDITEKMQAQNELQIAHAELARSAHVSRMGAMTASISHELNQPLSAIMANAGAGLRWMAKTPPELDEVRESFERIASDARRAADVIQGIRAMFKSEGTSRASFDLNQLISEVLALTQRQLQRHAIIVDTRLDERLPPVWANRTQLQQVLYNLLNNAVDAMELVADRPRVLLVKSELQDDGQVCVTVEDSGSGIVPDNLDRLFNSFFTTKAEGMGMGLSICRSIIESHGGHLWASPGATHGAVFRFDLPTGAS